MEPTQPPSPWKKIEPPVLTGNSSTRAEFGDLLSEEWPDIEASKLVPKKRASSVQPVTSSSPLLDASVPTLSANPTTPYNSPSRGGSRYIPTPEAFPRVKATRALDTPHPSRLEPLNVSLGTYLDPEATRAFSDAASTTSHSLSPPKTPRSAMTPIYTPTPSPRKRQANSDAPETPEMEPVKKPFLDGPVAEAAALTRPPTLRSSYQPVEPKECYVCKKLGHIAVNCRERYQSYHTVYQDPQTMSTAQSRPGMSPIPERGYKVPPHAFTCQLPSPNFRPGPAHTGTPVFAHQRPFIMATAAELHANYGQDAGAGQQGHHRGYRFLDNSPNTFGTPDPRQSRYTPNGDYVEPRLNYQYQQKPRAARTLSFSSRDAQLQYLSNPHNAQPLYDNGQPSMMAPLTSPPPVQYVAGPGPPPAHPVTFGPDLPPNIARVASGTASELEPQTESNDKGKAESSTDESPKTVSRGTQMEEEAVVKGKGKGKAVAAVDEDSKWPTAWRPSALHNPEVPFGNINMYDLDALKKHFAAKPKEVFDAIVDVSSEIRNISFECDDLRAALVVGQERIAQLDEFIAATETLTRQREVVLMQQIVHTNTILRNMGINPQTGPLHQVIAHVLPSSVPQPPVVSQAPTIPATVSTSSGSTSVPSSSAHASLDPSAVSFNPSNPAQAAQAVQSSAGPSQSAAGSSQSRPKGQQNKKRGGHGKGKN